MVDKTEVKIYGTTLSQYDIDNLTDRYYEAFLHYYKYEYKKSTAKTKAVATGRVQ